MTDKKTLIARWHTAQQQVDRLKAEVREAETELHAVLRELHGVPVGTRWRLRIKKSMFGAREEYEAVLNDIKNVSYFSRPETKPWATAFRIKKDGTPRDRAQDVYGDWEVIGPYEEKAL